MQISGYLITRKCEPVFAAYLERDVVKSHRSALERIWRECGVLEPKKYRGISNDPLRPMISLDERIIDEMRQSGLDMDSNGRARRRFAQIVAPDLPPEQSFAFDEDLLPTYESLCEVFRLLDDPKNFDSLYVSRDPFDSKWPLLGFDIGYWGGDHYSIICDSAIMPTWHGPAFDDLRQLGSFLGALNDNLLFQSVADAVAFRTWYKTRPWAEHDFSGDDFCIIRVEGPR